MLAVTIVLSGCWTADVRQASQKQPAAPPPSVIVMTVSRSDVPVYDEFTAQTQGTQSVDIKARVEGTLTKVSFAPGSLVHAGQVLFQIDPSQYQAALESAQGQLFKAQADLFNANNQVSTLQAKANLESKQANYGNAQSDVRRLTPLAKAQAVSQSDLDNAVTREADAKAAVDAAKAALADSALNSKVGILSAKAAIESANAAVTSAKINLGYTTIRSPASGIAGLIKVDPGNLVGRGDATLLTTVQTVDPIRAQFSISELDYIYLVQHGYHIGSPIFKMILANNAAYPYTGVAYALNNQLDPTTGTITVQANFPNPNLQVRPGQFVRIRVNTSEAKGAILIPQAAVSELQGTATVRLVGANDVVQQRMVSLGPTSGSNYIILNGLQPGERVIVQGIQKAEPGSKVKPVLQTAQAPGR